MHAEGRSRLGSAFRWPCVAQLSAAVLGGCASIAVAKSVVICLDDAGNDRDAAPDSRVDKTNAARLCDALVSDRNQAIKFVKGAAATDFLVDKFTICF